MVAKIDCIVRVGSIEVVVIIVRVDRTWNRLGVEAMARIIVGIIMVGSPGHLLGQ